MIISTIQSMQSSHRVQYKPVLILGNNYYLLVYIDKNIFPGPLVPFDPSRLTRLGWPVQAGPCLCCPFLTILSRLPCLIFWPGCLVHPLLSQLFCHSCPSCPGCLGFPVPVVLSQLSCFCCHVWPTCPCCPELSLYDCPGCKLPT